MESIASTSSPPDPFQRPYLHPRFKPNHPMAERIFRALRHHLRLLHRSQSNFFVLGATGNVYTVSLSSTPSCTCPDRTNPCKHILFVYIRALGVSLDDTCLRRRTLHPCQLSRLLTTPIIQESLAGAGVRKMFHQLFFKENNGRSKKLPQPIEIEDGTMCPICLDEIERRDRVVSCETCRNVVHEECWSKWKRSRGRRLAICVICRGKWRDKERITGQDKYLNLSAYVSDQNDMGESSSNSVLCGGSGYGDYYLPAASGSDL